MSPHLLVWDSVAERFYETGVSKAVLFVQIADGSYPLGVAWSGLTAIGEKPGGAEVTKKFADNIEYLALMSRETFALTIEAFTFPDEFGVCDGSVQGAPGVQVGQQARSTFGLAYRTEIGNDIDGNAHGYKLHLIYGCMASPSERSNASINEGPETMALSWEVTSSPAMLTSFEPVSHIVISSLDAPATELAAFEDIIYGLDTPVDARLPLPAEVITLLTAV